MAPNIKPVSARKLRLLVSSWFIKAVIFDLDGTIIDSQPSGFKKFAETAALFGYVFGEAERALLVRVWGKRVHILFKTIYPDAPEEDIKGMYDYFCSIDDRDVVPLFPGARETIERLHAAGLVLTILTSRELDTTTYMLERHGLIGYFTHIAAGNTVKNPKPHVDSLECTRRVLGELGIADNQCIVFGDTTDDFDVANDHGLIPVINRTGPLGIPDHPEMPAIPPENHIDSIADLVGWIETKLQAA